MCYGNKIFYLVYVSPLGSSCFFVRRQRSRRDAKDLQACFEIRGYAISTTVDFPEFLN